MSPLLPSGPLVHFLIPVKTVSEANMREHWAAKAKRKKLQTNAAYLVTFGELAKANAGHWPGWTKQPLTITLTRLAARALDADNLAGAFKGIQDGVAKALGVDDGDARLQWVYRQERAGRGRQGVMVHIQTTTEAERWPNVS